MHLRTTFPSREALRRLPFGWADIAVILGALSLVALVARVSAEAAGAFAPPAIVPRVSLDPVRLPEYAARSTLRMFVALACSVVFTLIYGTIAAHSRRAERVLIPLLDVLQSVPVLGFLSITITGFIALFPGSLLGLEAASVFAIFTAQAWNMTFSFYQSLRTVPTDLLEATRLFRLSRWERWTRLEVPAAMIGLVWNAMMSFGGGWFFVAASEAISVLNRTYTLPGMGSYVAVAVAAGDLRALGAAIATMAVVILVVDQLFWRPLVAWADRFRLELSAAEAAPQAWMLDLLRRTRLLRRVGRLTGYPLRVADRLLARLTRARDGTNAGFPRAWWITSTTPPCCLLWSCCSGPACASCSARWRPLRWAGRRFWGSRPSGGRWSSWSSAPSSDAGGGGHRLQPPPGAPRPARRPAARLVSGELPLPLRHGGVPPPRGEPQLGQYPPHVARRAVVHPVQRHRRRMSVPTDLREMATTWGCGGGRDGARSSSRGFSPRG